jgi:3',5'-cyclic AMP phosphodiesterase CpdA
MPGNHDAYTSESGWARALAGPLAPYAKASAAGDAYGAHLVDRAGVVFFPLNTSVYQNVAFSGGHLSDETVRALGERIGDPTFRGKTIVIVMHHPPFLHARRVWQYIDGLRGAARLMDLLVKNPQVQLLHGHVHRTLDRLIGGLGKHRVFGAPATVDDAEGRPRVRLYDVSDGGLESAGLFAT